MLPANIYFLIIRTLFFKNHETIIHQWFSDYLILITFSNCFINYYFILIDIQSGSLITIGWYIS
jgi:hypothetical protein